MQFRKIMRRRTAKLWAFLQSSAVKRKRNVSSNREDSESPRTLRRLGPSKPEFYGECNGSKYNLVALALL